MRNILLTAYDLQTFQIEAPEWLSTERYDIVAKVPEGATKEQVNIMWQNLLKERFGLTLHRESKEFQVDELTIAKGGPKLKPTDLESTAEPFAPTPGPPRLDKDGRPEMNGYGAIMTIFPGANGAVTAHMHAKGLTVAELVLRMGARRPVIDKTGLSGRYDVDLDYTLDLTGLPPFPPPPGGAPPVPSTGAPGDTASDPGSTMASALEKQLGLKLSPGKAKLDVIVVDHAEKTPTEN